MVLFFRVPNVFVSLNIQFDAWTPLTDSAPIKGPSTKEPTTLMKIIKLYVILGIDSFSYGTENLINMTILMIFRLKIISTAWTSLYNIQSKFIEGYSLWTPVYNKDFLLMGEKR